MIRCLEDTYISRYTTDAQAGVHEANRTLISCFADNLITALTHAHDLQFVPNYYIPIVTLMQVLQSHALMLKYHN